MSVTRVMVGTGVQPTCIMSVSILSLPATSLSFRNDKNSALSASPCKPFRTRRPDGDTLQISNPCHSHMLGSGFNRANRRHEHVDRQALDVLTSVLTDPRLVHYPNSHGENSGAYFSYSSALQLPRRPRCAVPVQPSH